MSKKLRSFSVEEERSAGPGLGLAALILLIGAIGVVGYMVIEDWNFLDSLYMVITTLATVGFREIEPLSPAGQIFTVILIILGIAVLYYVVKAVFEAVVSRKLEEAFTDKKMHEQIIGLRGHFVLIGWGRVGHEAARELVQARVPLVIVEQDPAKAAEAKAENFLVVEGNGTDEQVLTDAGVVQAKGMIVATADDGTNLLSVVTGKGLNPDLFIVARSNQAATASKLVKVGANRVVVPYRIGGARMAMMALKPQVADFIDEVVSTDKGHLQIEDIKVSTKSTLVGKPLSSHIAHQKSGVVVLALHRDNGRILINPTSDTPIEANDRLILMGTAESLGGLQQYL